MLVRYSWFMKGTMLFCLIVALLFIVGFSLAGALSYGLVFIILLAATIYGVVMCFATGTIDDKQIRMRLIWGATYQMDWSEVEVVKYSPSHFAFSGNGKWMTVPLQGVQHSREIFDFVDAQVDAHKLTAGPLAGLEYFRLYKNSKIAA